MYLFLTLCIAALLGLIPANIAKEKGYSFGLWWFYGWMLFIVAIIHVNFLPDKHAGLPPCHPEEAEPTKDLFPVSLTGGGRKKILRFAQDDMGKAQDNRGRSPGQAGLHASARGYAGSCAVVRRQAGVLRRRP